MESQQHAAFDRLEQVPPPAVDRIWSRSELRDSLRISSRDPEQLHAFLDAFDELEAVFEAAASQALKASLEELKLRAASCAPEELVELSKLGARLQSPPSPLRQGRRVHRTLVELFTLEPGSFVAAVLQASTAEAVPAWLEEFETELARRSERYAVMEAQLARASRVPTRRFSGWHLFFAAVVTALTTWQYVWR